MSAPRAIAELVVSSLRIFGKAAAAAGRQAAANARHKPEGMNDAASGDGKKSAAASATGMSLEEAHLILNVKKEESMEKILESYERIFKSNGPPAPPPAPPAGSPEAAAAKAKGKPKMKGPTHSHYLQSKVYFALERIKAERAEEIAAGSEGAAAEGAAAEAAAEAPPTEGKAPEQKK